MIKVTIDLWPFGSVTDIRHLCSFDIANDGRGTHLHGNYIVRYEGEEWSEPVVKDHPRNEEVLKLVYKVLHERYKDKNE